MELRAVWEVGTVDPGQGQLCRTGCDPVPLKKKMNILVHCEVQVFILIC